MKKLIIFASLFLLVCLCFSSVALAQGEERDGWDAQEYVEEKIAPVVAGVLTSVIALITTLGSISKSLGALKDTKTSFTAEAKERAESFSLSTEMLKAQAKEIKEMIECVPELESQLTELKTEVLTLVDQCATLSEILTLGFSANAEVIKSGKGQRMASLLENARERGTRLQ